MTRLRHITLALAVLCALGVLAAPAYALDNDYHHVIRECYDTGRLDGSKYTRQALQQARRHLPTDIREYSDCEDLINAALAAKNRRGGDGGGSGGGPPGGAPPNPALHTASGAMASSQQDLDALRRETDPRTRSNTPPAVTVGNRKLTPTTGGLLNAAHGTDANDLPLPLVLALAALAAMAAVAAATVLRLGWPETRRVAIRLLRR